MKGVLLMQKLKINSEFKNLIPQLQPEEFEQLEQNVLKEGCRDPLVVWDNTIIDGHNRYKICTEHNIEFNTVDKNFTDSEDAKQWIIKNQFGRRNLPLYERAKLALKLKDLIAAKAKAKQIASGGAVPQKSDKPPIDTSKELAKIAGTSHDTINKVRNIEEKGTPELKEQLSKGDISINKAYKEIKKEEKKQEVKANIQRLKEKEVKPPTGQYDVIVIDPPWEMKKIEREVAPNQVEFDYPTMTIEEIKNIKLPAEKDCHVFLWITQKHHKHGWDILEAWGARFICEFVWHKNGGFQPFNLPQFNHEYIMYARIGSPRFIDLKNFSTCFNADRKGHSVKPEEFYETLRRVTAGQRIDMFNRRQIEGFDVWGNEA